MNRLEVIQKTIDAISGKSYLEIGVEFGTVFLRIRAKHKVAVDPHFRIPFLKKWLWPRRLFSNHYYEMTSDAFFKRFSKVLSDRKVDVVFIDGLHTYEQSFIDVLNSLIYLRDGGVIIIHDCNPPNEAAAADSMEVGQKMPGWNKSWCGDVWKTIVRLRSERNDLSIFVLNCDMGLGVITRRKPEQRLSYSRDEIKKMTYRDLIENKEKLLNLKDPKYFDVFIQRLSSVSQ